MSLPLRSFLPRPCLRTGNVVMILLLLSMCSAPSVPGQTPEVDSSLKFRPIRVLNRRRVIQNVPVMSADEVSEEVTDRELVLGVVVNGEARAYPINMLTGPQREIINDVLGERSIAATW